MPLFITEYARLAMDERGNVIAAGQEPCQTVQAIAIGASSTPSSAFGSVTRFVRVHTDANCAIEFRSANPGVDPVAVAGTSMRLPAGATEFFGVRPGQKVAVVQSS